MNYSMREVRLVPLQVFNDEKRRCPKGSELIIQ